ncbi:MAG: hypothetical protein JRJ87_18235 [Deltaproteobacteria bacterium]|nr:hypothetical protein [Deltaproteobacteria bacterium]
MRIGLGEILLVGALTLIQAGCGQTDRLCEDVDCSGHGRCAIRNSEATCLCDPGFLSDGTTCLADPCRQAVCIHGTCQADQTTASCNCDPGYTGEYCDLCAEGYHAEELACIPDSPCDDKLCIHGVCRLVSNVAVCDCRLGYAGESCDECAAGYHSEGLECLRNSACDPDPCVHGICTDLNGQAVCSCKPGYVGQRCNQCDQGYLPAGLYCLPEFFDPCDPNPCLTINRSICVIDGQTYACQCDPGFHEELSECLADSACSPNPCQQANRTVCRLAGDGHVCNCDAGYHLEDSLCVEDSVCNPETTCSGNGSCSGNGLECICNSGYTGAYCEQCDSGYHPQGDQCVPNAACDPNPCTDLNRTVCVEQDAGYLCQCDPGYQDGNNDGTCRPDCTSANLNCSEHAHCEIITGLAMCTCDSGYQDNDQNGSCEETCLTANLACPDGEICDDRSGSPECVSSVMPPIYITFHWHMHQPIYWPYESIVDTEAAGSMGYSLYSIHSDRTGPYTSWPRDAIDSGRSLAHMGAQVSISGSLIENLNNMAAAGAGFANWTDPWAEAMTWQTAESNPRLDLVNFGYHHPLMGLVDATSIQLQIDTHREVVSRNFNAPTSKGIFPPECAFSERMIPALVAQGIEWVMVDNIHFDRAHSDYPFRPESNLPAPNVADQVNSDQTAWIQLNGLWAPSEVSAPWGYQPHYVEYIDPETGQSSRMIAVPAARYEGNEDARGGFGALQYEAVFSQYEHLNTDPAHPMLIVLHHDGDNYGGGTESYYHSNFQAFVSWVASQPDRFVATTIQDYLDRFPPDINDVIHVEDGSWSGADNGDPEFQKWNGDPGPDGYSPDRNSWAVITAAKNRLLTAESIQPHSSAAAIVDAAGNDTDKAWYYFLNGETSCYWYWDNSMDGIWDSHPTRAANTANSYADQVISSAADTVGPTIYLPQREPYNPGQAGQSSDITIWTYVYDVSGLANVSLHVRVDQDGVRDAANEIYSGGSWQQVTMIGESLPARTSPPPLYKADQYVAQITGLTDKLVDYYISAGDNQANLTKSSLMHVYIGSSGGTPDQLWTPENPTSQDIITIIWNQPANLHWGVDASLNGDWSPPPNEYWPSGSVLWSDGKSIESPLNGPDPEGRYSIQIGPFNQTTVAEVNFVFHNESGSWSSPDQTIQIGQ